MDTPKFSDQLKLTFINSVRTPGAVKRISLECWPIGTDSERETKDSVLSAHLDDDDDDDGIEFYGTILIKTYEPLFYLS